MHRLRNVCEVDGDCQEDAVVSVSVWRRSPRVPVAAVRACAVHGDRFLRLPEWGKDYDVQVDQGVQLTLL
jgi:hypothetical protein